MNIQEIKKPRITLYNSKVECIKFICQGEKGRFFHVAFGIDPISAYEKWTNTEPMPSPLINDDDFPF